LDLPSHLSFGLAVGLVFFGNSPEIVLLIGLGTLIPDLDREYWYVRRQVYAEEQYHRARFHNVFVILVGYLVNPFFSLGIFLHMLQDSFTTAKDRGVEWFYPLTRLVKRGMYDQTMSQRKPDPSVKVYFYQEDVLGYVNAADPDLREGDQPVPWRRVYGFAQNGHLLDRGIPSWLFSSHRDLVGIPVWVCSCAPVFGAHRVQPCLGDRICSGCGLVCCRGDSEERQASQASTVEAVSGPIVCNRYRSPSGLVRTVPV